MKYLTEQQIFYLHKRLIQEFGAYKSLKDNAPKYVLSLEKFDMSADGIIHLSIEDWLLHKKDLILF